MTLGAEQTGHQLTPQSILAIGLPAVLGHFPKSAPLFERLKQFSQPLIDRLLPLSHFIPLAGHLVIAGLDLRISPLVAARSHSSAFCRQILARLLMIDYAFTFFTSWPSRRKGARSSSSGRPPLPIEAPASRAGAAVAFVGMHRAPYRGRDGEATGRPQGQPARSPGLLKGSTLPRTAGHAH
jgi:hypothetical protein